MLESTLHVYRAALPQDILFLEIFRLQTFDFVRRPVYTCSAEEPSMTVNRIARFERRIREPCLVQRSDDPSNSPGANRSGSRNYQQAPMWFLDLRELASPSRPSRTR